jgi:hypothetical protein
VAGTHCPLGDKRGLASVDLPLRGIKALKDRICTVSFGIPSKSRAGSASRPRASTLASPTHAWRGSVRGRARHASWCPPTRIGAILLAVATHWSRPSHSFSPVMLRRAYPTVAAAAASSSFGQTKSMAALRSSAIRTAPAAADEPRSQKPAHLLEGFLNHSTARRYSANFESMSAGHDAETEVA